MRILTNTTCTAAGGYLTIVNCTSVRSNTHFAFILRCETLGSVFCLRIGYWLASIDDCVGNSLLAGGSSLTTKTS
jgi:hypothetical protein